MGWPVGSPVSLAGIGSGLLGMDDRAGRKRRSASVPYGVCSLPAMAVLSATFIRPAGAGRPLAPASIAQFRAGRSGEEPMTTTTILLCINSFAQLIAAVAQVIMALRQGRR